MVIDKMNESNPEDKLERLIELKDDLSLINEDYESYIYYCSVIIRLFKDTFNIENTSLNNYNVINNYLDTIISYLKNINKRIKTTLKTNEDSVEKIKLITHNIHEKSQELNKSLNYYLDIYYIKIADLHDIETQFLINQYINELKNKILLLCNISGQLNNQTIKEILILSGNTIPTEVLELRFKTNQKVNIEKQNKERNCDKILTGLCIFILFIVICVVFYIKFYLSSEAE